MRLVLLLLVLVALVVCTGGCVRRRGGTPPPAAQTQVLPPPGIDYTVQQGDTLTAIAKTYGIQVRTIVDANQLTGYVLTPGMILRLPGVTKAIEAPKPSWYVPRAAWATAKVDLSNIDPMGVKPYRITVHHTGEMSVSPLDSIGSLREIERQHMAGAGKNTPFACIGYHFIIAVDGTVYEGRPLKFQGAHATGPNNHGNIGICLLGDFDHHRPSTAQVNTLVALLDRFCAEYGITSGPRTVLCHKDFKPTECPGRYLEPIIRDYAEGRMRR